MAACLPFVFFIAWCGVIGCYVAHTGDSLFERQSEVVWQIGPIVGYITTVLVLTIALVAAALIGICYRIKAKRNLMPTTMQAACYLSGYLVVWTAAVFLWTMVMFASEDVLRDIARGINVDRELLFLGIWALPNLLAFVPYLVLVARITSGARHANL